MVNVWVDLLTNPVPLKRIGRFLDSYLPAGTAGHLLRRFGLPAATEIEPGCVPSGQGSGTIASLVVLDGTTVYDVFTVQGSSLTAEAIIASFRLVH